MVRVRQRADYLRDRLTGVLSVCGVLAAQQTERAARLLAVVASIAAPLLLLVSLFDLELGDVMGLAEQFVERILGPETIAPAFAGASGNIDPWFRVLPSINIEPGWIPEPVLLGTLLGEEIVHVCRDIDEVSDDGRIGTAFVTLELPGKPRSADRIEKDHPPTELNITVARIGEIGFVGLGAEVLTEIGMAIKEASPCKHTFVITHCNGAASYIAPEHLHIEGGYEIRSSPFAPQAAEIAVKQAVKMLHEI
jgi:hypothetical protein